ncbi:VOC family protein [Boseongicola sp. H5]|uniref:bleomycin resistance protein n=1 Tax=Boseongicola sp. H5 TaxID=2763261 RepID=UPI001D0A9751|nr:VOC family protein [Boseongicola sp. H5]
MTHEEQFRTDPDHWSVLVPEMLVRDLPSSLVFYLDLLGFTERFGRPEDGFVYIEMGHAQIMLEAMPDDVSNAWVTGALSHPLGRGLNLQIEVVDVRAIHDRLIGAGIALFRPLRRSWYREDQHENGQDEFLVQDPDGYLLRFMQHVGSRPASPTSE